MVVHDPKTRPNKTIQKTQRPRRRQRTGKRNVRVVPLAVSKTLTNSQVHDKNGLVSGVDLLEKVTSGMTGFVVNTSCNPATWSNTRIATIAGIYGMYRPKSIKLSWKSCCSATTPGAMVYGISTGENITTNSGEEACRALISTAGSKMFNVWADHEWSVPLTFLPQKFFYVDGEHDIDSEPFRILGTLVDTTASPDTSLGYLTIRYEYQFVQPTAGQNVIREVTKAITTVAQSQPGPIEVNLGTNAKWVKLVAATVTEALKAYIPPGVEVILTPTVVAGVYALATELGPVVTTATLAAQAVTAAFKYVTSMFSEDPVIECALPNACRYGRVATPGLEEEHFLAQPVSVPTGTQLGSRTLNRK